MSLLRSIGDGLRWRPCDLPWRVVELPGCAAGRGCHGSGFVCSRRGSDGARFGAGPIRKHNGNRSAVRTAHGPLVSVRPCGPQWHACCASRKTRSARAPLDGDWLEQTRGVRFTSTSANLYSSCTQKPCQWLAAGRAFRSLIEERLESCSRGGRSCSRSADLRRNDLGEAGSPCTIVSTDWCAAATCARGATTGMPLHGRIASVQANEALLRYAERVSVVPNESLQHVFPRQWPAIVEVDGPRGTTEVLVARGDPADRPNEEDMVEKVTPRSQDHQSDGGLRRSHWSASASRRISLLRYHGGIAY
jgi:hypothetical protein